MERFLKPTRVFSFLGRRTWSDSDPELIFSDPDAQHCLKTCLLFQLEAGNRVKDIETLLPLVRFYVKMDQDSVTPKKVTYYGMVPTTVRYLLRYGRYLLSRYRS